MKRIAYYISDYGHGHAARSIAIIRELLTQRDDVQITICTSFTMDFLKRALIGDRQWSNDRLTFRNVTNDIGFILKDNSVMPDIERFEVAYQKYIDQSEAYIEQEMNFMNKEKIDIVLCDIPPFPFVAADRLNIPSIGLSNFTWYTAYLDLLSEESLEPLKQAYRKMTYFIRLLGCKEPKWACEKQWYGDVYSRAINEEKVSEIRKLVDPSSSGGANEGGRKTIVYFGLGMKIGVDDLSKLPLWQSEDCVFIVSSNSDVEGEGIFKIPADDTETQNYVAAADIVISKPGWSTVSEAIAGECAMLIINRSNMREDQNTIEYLLEEYDRCELVEWDALKELVIDQPLIERLKLKEPKKLGTVPHGFKAVKQILDIIDMVK